MLAQKTIELEKTNACKKIAVKTVTENYKKNKTEQKHKLYQKTRINPQSSLPMMKLFANPIVVNVASAPDNFQLELLDMQSDIEIEQLFQSEDLLEFWNRVPDGKYPNLKTNAQKNVSVFGSTYVCEALFSKMVRIKNQYRNRLTNDHLKQLLRTACPTIAPRFDKLVKA